MPIGIRLGLVFRETQIITKFDLQGRRASASTLEEINQINQINSGQPAGGGV
jgi:hypothetical protein